MHVLVPDHWYGYVHCWILLPTANTYKKQQLDAELYMGDYKVLCGTSERWALQLFQHNVNLFIWQEHSGPHVLRVQPQ